jgi:arylsulfatase
MLRFLSLAILSLILIVPVIAQDKPNILVIWGDDIGQFNVSAYNMGMMGYKTPNIDQIAKEGAIFTDWYGQQSCTAGRAAFITGQSPIRTGLTKVGLPGAPEGMKKEDPTIAVLLKEMGYATGQFGKNHLGDRDEMLPSNHGFDEFYIRIIQGISCFPMVKPCVKSSARVASSIAMPTAGSKTPAP